jgi:hypothetical protein
MKAPANAQLYETAISTLWFDESGFLFGNSKKIERKIEHYKELMEIYKKLSNDGKKKLWILADSSNASPMSKEIVDYLALESPKYLHAMAILTTSSFGSSQVNTFLKLSFANFPVMLFSDEDEALTWLKDQMHLPQ